MNAQSSYQVPGRAPVEPFPDSPYWSRQFSNEPYYLEGDRYEDYEPAYRLGHGARTRYPGRDFSSFETDLQREWDSRKGPSRLDWNRARLAVMRAWERGEPHDM